MAYAPIVDSIPFYCTMTLFLSYLNVGVIDSPVSLGR